MDINCFMKIFSRNFHDVASLYDYPENCVEVTLNVGTKLYETRFDFDKIEKMTIAEVYCLLADISRKIEKMRSDNIIDALENYNRVSYIKNSTKLIYDDFMKGIK